MTNHSIDSVLNLNAHTLLEKGAHTRTVCNLAKLVGLVGLISGAVGCGVGHIETGATAATLGGILYVGAAAKELGTTGKLMPVPFFSADIGMIARSAGVHGEKADTLTEIDYLTRNERAKLAMATTLKPLTVALDNLPPGEQSTAYYMLANGLTTLYPEVIDQVGIMPALLPEMGGLEGIRTQLSQQLPPAHREVFESTVVPQVSAAPLPRALPAQPQRTAKPQPAATAQYVPVRSRQQQQPEAQAIDVPARTVERKPQEPMSAPSHQYTTVTALDTLQKSPFRSLAWFGGQRTGKSYLAAVGSRQLHEEKGVRVFHINLASYGDEDAYYWSHVDDWDSICCDISSMDIPTAKQRISDAVQIVMDFYAHTNALLIVDEFAFIGGKTNQHSQALEPLLKVLADKIATLASTGMKRGKAMWTLSPEFVASSLVRDALAIKKLGLVFCAISPGHKACWKDEIGQAHELTFDWALYEMVSNNYTIEQPPAHSPHARTVFLDGQWISAGVTGEELKALAGAAAQ